MFDGVDVAGLSDSALTKLRRENIGFIFQSFNLIEELTVVENVEIALLYRRIPGAERRRRSEEALTQVGMAPRSRHRPQQLSGGQQQRVAVARALVSEPKLILADEPTGNLDTANGQQVMALLSAAATAGVTIAMVTHSLGHAAASHRTISLLDGRVVSDAQLAA